MHTYQLWSKVKKSTVHLNSRSLRDTNHPMLKLKEGKWRNTCREFCHVYEYVRVWHTTEIEDRIRPPLNKIQKKEVLFFSLDSFSCSKRCLEINIIYKRKKNQLWSNVRTYARVVRQQNRLGKKQNYIRTFYRLSFTYFQGLCSMELQRRRRRRRRKKKDSQTLRAVIVNDTWDTDHSFFMIQNE